MLKLGLAATLIVLPQMGLAQDTEAVPGFDEIGPYIMTTLLFCIAGFLVFFMAAGFAMLEGGLVRSKNVTMQMTKNIGLYSFAAIMYWLIGFNLMYPGDGWTIAGWVGPFFSQTVLDPVGVAAADADLGYASIGSDFFFQLVFVAATASIVSGALAERIKLWPFLIFVILLTGVMYPISGSWQWGGGWLAEAGFSDFAGSTVVHSVGGWAALAGAIVPKIPAKRWTGMAPTTSSILSLSRSGTVKTTITPPTAPIQSAPKSEGARGSAVIDTRPASAPFSTIVRSGFLYMIWLRISAVTAPAAAAILVLAKMRLTSLTSPTVPIASCEPPLKPNQPSHRMKVPKVARARFEPGIGCTRPSLPNLPRRGPSTMAPAKAAQPPTECTTVEPAKSLKPISDSQPPPHCQEPEIG